MASRVFTQHRNSLEKVVVDLFAEVSFGNTGAPTLVSGHNKGIASISRSSAGKYVITLADQYVRLLAANAAFIVASGVPAAPLMFVVSDSSGASSKQVTVQFNAASGTSGALEATDPASGEKVKLVLQLSNSTAI